MQAGAFWVENSREVAQYRVNMGGDYRELISYIENYWPILRRDITGETKTAFGLPNPYYAPSTEAQDRFSFPYMFYWDSYFICQGLWGTEREPEIVGMAENMFDLVQRFGFMPTSNSVAHMSRSQPPLLSSLVMQIADSLKKDDPEWLNWAYDSIAEELRTCWYGERQPHIRRVHAGLSRYYDFNVLHSMAEAESGWDYTDRFGDECLNYLPIDLNSLLYKCERDLAELARRLDRSEEAASWDEAANIRREMVNHHMWHVDDGFFYDFNFITHELSSEATLAAFMAMYTGLASEEQAAQIVEFLPRFETEHGLTTTESGKRDTPLLQWTAPNGWAPLHDIVVEGLLKYGYEEDARRIAGKWLATVKTVFDERGVIQEKYNVVDANQPPKDGVYPDQIGFGWTNAITYKFFYFLNKG